MWQWHTKHDGLMQGPFEYDALRARLHELPAGTQFQIKGLSPWIGLELFTIAKSECDLLPPPPPLPPPTTNLAKAELSDTSTTALSWTESAASKKKISLGNRRDFMGSLGALGAVVAAVFAGMKKSAKTVTDNLNSDATRSFVSGLRHTGRQQYRDSRKSQEKSSPFGPRIEGLQPLNSSWKQKK